MTEMAWVEVPKHPQLNEKDFDKNSEKGDVSVQVGRLNLPAKLSKQSQDLEKDRKGGIDYHSEVNGGIEGLNGSPVEALKQLAKDMKEEAKVLDVSPSGALQQSQGASKATEKVAGKPAKRKRSSVDGSVLFADKGSLVTECHRELDCLFEFYKELSDQSLNLEKGTFSSNNAMIACMLEESNLCLSKLVEMIYEKLKGKEGVTSTHVRNAVLSVGQRMMYGISNADADVLEDESESCLWCWETRDMKLLPANQRADLNVRRVARKKVHERISALSATLSALAAPENEGNYKSNLTKASMKLGKALNLEEIRSFVEKRRQKHDTSMAERTAKVKEKESYLEVQKEKLQNMQEKEVKQCPEEAEKEEKCRVKEEAEKEEKRRVKEEAELKKHLKKQQEEAERDRRRRERAEAELKEQRSLKKQATIMERFLKAKKSSNDTDNVQKQLFMEGPICDSPSKARVVNATTSLMDNAFTRKDNLPSEDLRKLHVDGWRKLSHHNRSSRWGIRRKPKVELVKELKLHDSSTDIIPSEKSEIPLEELASVMEISRGMGQNRLLDGSEKSSVNDATDTVSASVRLLRKKLLQFDKSNRPAYYGTWSKKSSIGPRHPFKKDPDLDYDFDSDEEWEEEEPGESLSDCEKDIEEECLEGNSKDEDDDESEDDFFVPDGYLSENEGVPVDKADQIHDEDGSSTCSKLEFESEEIRLLQQQQKYLQSATEQALRKGHPLLISNLMHEKSGKKMTEDINGTLKIELMCLQALCMQACAGDSIIDLSLDNLTEKEVQEVPESQNKSNNNTPTPTTAVISDSDLPEFVSSIRSNSQGISKVLESLQGKFPTTPKSQLKNKVKEISDYVDNRWQVKKEILEKLGLSTSPVNMKRKGITTFFSKRCLPPELKSVGASEPSVQQIPKTEVLHDDSTRCT